ncbi:hypothetical protein GOP47_0031091, partial [Adiantum capillus-veneris]
RRVKVSPPWLNVMMDDIEEEKENNDMQGEKGNETGEEEHNEDVFWEDDFGDDEIPNEQAEDNLQGEKKEGTPGEDNLQEEKKEDGGVLEGEGSKAKEGEAATSSGSTSSSSQYGLGDTPLYEMPPCDDAKNLSMVEAEGHQCDEPNNEHIVDTFDRFSSMTLNIGVSQNE